MCWDRAVEGMTLTVSIKADWRGEGGRETNLEVRFHPPLVPLWVLFLSLPVTSEIRWQVPGVRVSSTHCPLVFLRHESAGGGSGLFRG